MASAHVGVIPPAFCALTNVYCEIPLSSFPQGFHLHSVGGENRENTSVVVLLVVVV